MLDGLAVPEADEVHVGLPYRASGREDAHKLTLVGGMPGEAVHDLIALGDHILYRGAHVGAGEAEHGEETFVALEVRRCLRLVVDELRGEDISPAQ